MPIQYEKKKNLGSLQKTSGIENCTVVLKLLVQSCSVGIMVTKICCAGGGSEAVGQEWSPREQRVPCGGFDAKFVAPSQSCQFNRLLCRRGTTPLGL